MSRKHGTSGSTSSAMTSAGLATHVKRRSGGQHAASAPRRAVGGGDPNLVGLGWNQDVRSNTSREPISTSKRSSPSNSIGYTSSTSSVGDEEWSPVSMQHEVERTDVTEQPLPSSSRSTPSKSTKPSSTTRSDGSSWQPFARNWTPEKAKGPAHYTEDALLMNGFFDQDVHASSPFRLHLASPGIYRSPSSSSSFYRSDSLPMIASTSQSSASQHESSLSPSISFNTLSPSRPLLDPRRNSDTTLSIAPSPPMPSSSFQPHHLSSPNSLTNRTSPKSGPHTREGSLSSACMPVHTSTSAFFASARRRPSVDLARDMSDAPRSASAPTLQKGQARQTKWNAFSWKRRKRSPSDEGAPIPGRMSSSQQAQSAAMMLAAACLGPFFPLVFPSHPNASMRPLSKSSSGQPRYLPTSSYRRWQSRAFRSLLGLYIFYSLFLFTSRILSLPWASATPKTSSEHRTSSASPEIDTSEYTTWQQARFKLLDVYNVAADAIGSTALLIGRQTSKAAAGDFAGESNGANSLNNLMLLDRLPEVKRQWGETTQVRDPAANPLTSFSTEYRFSKMFSKADSSVRDQIEPFFFQAESPGQGGNVTACLYFNDAWVSQLPEFMDRWRGPVSIVYELAENKSSTERTALISRLDALRTQYPLIRAYADIHAVYNSPQSDIQARRLRERLILRPVASNLQLNLARFFAKTDMVWLVSDARVLPAPNLRQKLNALEEVRSYTMDFADGVIVPMFGATRHKTGNSTALPLLAGVKDSIGIDAQQDGVAQQEFEQLSKAYISAHYASIPLAKADWPINKTNLVGLASSHPPASVLPEYLQGSESPIFALFDRRWEAGKGPTSFANWRSSHSPAEEEADASAKDKSTVSVKPGFYQVTDYDLNYAPSLVIGRDRQPWCTERFEYNRAACIYQMYLQGAKKWVLPDAWAYTLEETNKHAPKERKNDAEKMKSSIQSRLYTKFFSEACMHYGRAFLSNDLWDSERAQHLRYSCARVLNSYGIGMSEEEEAAAAKLEQQAKKKQKQKKKKKK